MWITGRGTTLGVLGITKEPLAASKDRLFGKPYIIYIYVDILYTYHKYIVVHVYYRLLC